MFAAIDLEVTSDTTGSLDFGAYLRRQRFYGPWSLMQAQQSIAYYIRLSLRLCFNVFYFYPHISSFTLGLSIKTALNRF